MSDALSMWSPSLKVFVRRSIIVGAFSIAVLSIIGWAIGKATGVWQLTYVAPVLVLAYNIGFEDPARWRAARQNRWYLRSDALIHHGPEGEARIPLADVLDVRKRLSWSAVVFLKGGLRIPISYVENPADVVTQILAARNRLSP